MRSRGADRHDVELVRFLWADLNGVLRATGVAHAALPARMRSGIGLAATRYAAHLLDVAPPVDGLDDVREVRATADPGTFGLLPHAPGAAAVLTDLVRPDGTPWPGCPRGFLRGAIDRAAGLGFEVVAAFEPEFTLLRRDDEGALVPLDDSVTFEHDAFDLTNDFVVEVCRALRAHGIEVELYHPEFAAGQHEMTIGSAPALRAADNHVWQRVLIRGIARTYGWHATFAPAPLPGLRGNGNHLHLSLWREGVGNAFADPAGALGLSPTARHFIAGVLEHLPGLTALLAPSLNSYRRLQRGMWSGAFGCYGPDNREAAVRVPAPLRGDERGSANIEVKPCDGTANPYLALGAVIHAGLDGVVRELDPGPPVAGALADLSEAELDERGVRWSPRSLEEAVDALARDEFLLAALGSPLSELYLAVKRADILDLKGLDDAAHHALYTARY
ncbi:glutamine synthetase family protein [Lentzea sp. NPDC003310]|uniref:glutamine synthetase family protein n=1 Tax=Lentzea sp. NPDC003310 TaxID=3154447 RepID=UPI0033A473D2